MVYSRRRREDLDFEVRRLDAAASSIEPFVLLAPQSDDIHTRDRHKATSKILYLSSTHSWAICKVMLGLSKY